MTTVIDYKGLTEDQVQYAIEKYIRDRASIAWKQKYESERQDNIAKLRKAQGARLRLVNAIKRGNVSVQTQSRYSTGQVYVPSHPTDGWYLLALTPARYNPRMTDEQKAEYDKRLSYLLQRLQNNSEIDFVMETTLVEIADAPKVVTVYKTRLKGDPTDV